MLSWDSRRIWSTNAWRARSALERRVRQSRRGRLERVDVEATMGVMSTSARWPWDVACGFPARESGESLVGRAGVVVVADEDAVASCEAGKRASFEST